MNPSKRGFPRSERPGLLLICLATLLSLGTAQTSYADDASRQRTLDAGVEAYVYGYPLVTMEMTRRVMTNVAAPDGRRAPMGQFANLREYPSAAFRDVTAPNADTLYSVAWVDLSREPFILSIPEERGRYFMMPVLDAWTNVVIAPGARTTGTRAQRYALVGPGWKGRLPQGVSAHVSPTNLVWILGRTYSSGTPADYAATHAIQDRYSVVPLSAYGKPRAIPRGAVDPKIDMKAPVREQVERLSAAAYFKLLAELLKQNPPAAADAPIIARMATLGIVPGKDFDLDKIPPAIGWSLREAARVGAKKIHDHQDSAGIKVNGWTYPGKTGVYGTDYLQRAFIAYRGLGANLPEDAVYPTTSVDADGKPLTGAHRYVLHFPKGQTPPTQGFWSLTMYNPDYFFVANPLDRHALGSRSPFELNQDGSLDIYIQKDSPGAEREFNWLPAPAGNFVLMMRLYWPERSILDGAWKPPSLKRVK